MTWNQPRSNRRAVYISSRYMTLPFAEELSGLMGCPAEKGKLPGDEFLEEARRPPPLYFEIDDRTLQGVRCVCATKRDAWEDVLIRDVDY
eukprot:12228909-Karenia_brevis.AAC.1